MNNLGNSESAGTTDWECIDPVVGDCLWELEVENTTEARTQQLQAHLQLCDACRLDKALSGRLEMALQAGELILPSAQSRVWWERPETQAGLGSALMAACLALIMILPPAPSGDFVHLRGGPDDPHFIHPVEGEMVVPSSTVLSWQPIDGVTSYQVTLTDVDGNYHWVGSTQNTELKLPVLNQDQQTLRAVLSTVPADLVAPGRISVSFSTGNRLQLAQDRLLKAPAWLVSLACAGFALLGLSWFSRQRQQV